MTNFEANFDLLSRSSDFIRPFSEAVEAARLRWMQVLQTEGVVSNYAAWEAEVDVLEELYNEAVHVLGWQVAAILGACRG